VDDLELVYYAPITDKPGFFHILLKTIGELKAARIRPEELSGAVADLDGEPRLGELARTC
jgi:ATP-dependent helicase/DNAse subunit B